MFGDTVPGGQGGDVWREGNFQSPMYGTYAAKAFLNANVAPLTYVRLLGDNDSKATADGTAGWQTTKSAANGWANNGGAIGLWVWPSSSGDEIANGLSIGTGRLAAVFYQNASASLVLTGAYATTGTAGQVPAATANGTDYVNIGGLRMSDSNGVFEMIVSGGANTGNETIKFTFDDSLESYARKRFNTNPALVSAKGAFFNSASHEGYWLGQTYDQSIRDAGIMGAKMYGTLVPIFSGTVAPSLQRAATQEAKAGWFIGQQIGGLESAYQPDQMQKLFRFVGRGHGEWLQRNCKISIANIRKSYTSTSDDRDWETNPL